MTAEPLTGSGAEFFGIDVSQQMIRSGRNRVGNLAACHLAVSRIEELPFPDGFFDAVLCTGVLEYVEDDGVAVRELRRVLKREGNLIVSLLNGVSPYRAVENLELALHGRTRPEKMFTERYCRNLLRECAFEIVDILYFDFNVFLPPLDRRFPRWAVWTSERLEFLGRSMLRRVGTAFLVKAVKTA